MVLSKDQSVSILYDLAVTMAGQTQPRALSTAMLQRLMIHTGSACGALVLRPQPGEKEIRPRVYVSIGNKALHELAGQTADWSAGLMAGNDGESKDGWFPGGAKYHHALSLEVPAAGCVLLFSASPFEQAEEAKRVLTPILSKFAGSLLLCLEHEANVQALAQSEARFRGMLESTSDWIWEVDTAALITFSSNKVLDLLGYAPEEMLGHSQFDFMPRAEARHAIWTFKEIAGNKRAFHAYENIFLNKKGQTVVLETSGVPIFDAQGKFSGYRGISRDVTARRQILDELTEAKEMAESANRAKSLFLSSISHELRTPLNAILGYAQLIEMQDGQVEETAAQAREILQAGRGLLALLNDLLDFTRIESGEMEMRIETFPIAEVINACIDKNAGAATWKTVPVNCDASCDQCCITADRRCMLQVLDNLVSNAIKFNHEGGQVNISCNTRNSRLSIAVTDTGPGIAPDLQKQLFKPFNRAGLELGSIAGAGLGLAAVKQQVERMGGKIWVESAPGKGSTFWVEMPSLPTDGKTLDCDRQGESPEPNNALPRNIRVLVAEDYPPNQTLLRIQLSSLGCGVDIAANGEEAFAMWNKGQYDLILTDLNMPVMDGLSLAQAVRKQEAGAGSRIPIICITAAANHSEFERCLGAGVDDTLTKPITLDGLRDILTRWARLPGNTNEDAVLDLDSLYRILGEVNLNQGRQLVATFIESARKGLEQLASGNDSAAIAREMHKQKSSARTVGAWHYAKLAVALEQQVKNGGDVDTAASLAALSEGLSAVEMALSELGEDIKTAPSRPPISIGFDSLLVVDDDPVVLQQISLMLTTLGVKEILTASNGFEALKLLNERNGQLDALICDLNMPGMDGVELIRLFGRTGFKGGLILMSGAGEKVLSTVGKLADLQGLRVLGQISKPVTPAQMAGLLSHATVPRVQKRANAVTAHVTSKSIRDGIDKDEFLIWFQPKVDAITLKPVGVEALARWQHPGRGMLSPDAFIGVAEREGLVGELSQILASKALMQGALMHDAGFPLNIALNLSGLWLDDLMLPDFILATTRAAKLQPSNVILEVTETGVMKDLATALDVLTRLRIKGFGLSIDDFGIGYSSFEQLDRIPFTELKLDRSFVSKGAQDATARAILQSSMDMARRMALSTVAEGVETEDDLTLVREIGCERVQGYLIAKPMAIENLIAWLRGSKGNLASV